jgi:hypothetical protein
MYLSRSFTTHFEMLQLNVDKIPGIVQKLQGKYPGASIAVCRPYSPCPSIMISFGGGVDESAEKTLFDFVDKLNK